MLTFTLETNSLVALENNEPSAIALRALLARREAEAVRVQLVATTASERQRDGGYSQNFETFLARARSIGFDQADLLKPVGIWDMTYWGWCLWAGDEVEGELRRIHEVLFQSPYEYELAVSSALTGVERDKAEKNWRNRRLDGLGLHCHIHSGNDVFVTSDKNFHKATKCARLVALGAKKICSPDDAVRYAANHA